MHERFTDRARRVMQLAHQEAGRLNHEYVGTEHVLLGLLIEGSGVAANVLRSLAVDVRKLRMEIDKIVPPGAGDEPVTQVPSPSPPLLARMLERFSGSREGRRLPQTPRVKKLIEYAYEEARYLNHNYVGTEHLLLGLLRERDSVAAQVLLSTGLKLESVREEVLQLLGHDMPMGVSPAHVVVLDALNAVLNAPAELTAEQRQLVRDRVRHLNEQKEVFVAALDFVLAARCRAEAETLALLLAWYEQGRESR